jgi:hypothetical protein
VSVRRRVPFFAGRYQKNTEYIGRSSARHAGIMAETEGFEPSMGLYNPITV